MDGELLQIGTVRSVNPARRELRIVPYWGREHEFVAPKWLNVEVTGGEVVRCRVETVGPVGEAVRITVGAGVSRDVIASLKGCVAVIAPHDAAPRPEGPVRAVETVGMRAFDTDAGAWLGSITGVYETGATDVIEITRQDGGTMLVPFLDEVLNGIDFEQGVLSLRSIAAHAVNDED